MTFFELKNDALRVSIADLGAELSSLRDRLGRELLWSAGPVWSRHAPVLFPIVGRVPQDRFTVDGHEFTMTQHGFARDLPFETERLGDSSLSFTLVDSEKTREIYPYPFLLQLHYSLLAGTLEVRHRLVNTGETTLYASLGAHPGFAWPLPGAKSRALHSIEFDREEPAPIRRIEGGLLRSEEFPTPIVGRTLELDDSVFAEDAIIFDQLQSRAVRYTAPGAPVITLRFPDFPILGVWSKIPGEFVCIEPWYGMTAPLGFSGDFAHKPGQLSLAPGESRELVYSISVEQ